MHVRSALSDDAVKICDILRRSITDLCTADHEGRDDILLPWLANKTPENVSKWIGAPFQLLLVAEIGSAMAGVGLATDEGEILLNYVAPEFRFHGVSKALMSELESYLLRREVTVAHLVSTETARRFYRERGYGAAGEPQIWRGGKLSYPMKKQLAP
ncbi:GNAT family N-acetyltransferase [Brucella intermedia]|uniref:GNAT family N-acetyltransferase n=1 Tax=Brucella intermedia TaxID=94625 RepID=UPI000EFA5D90|nr:GNAT family N-acetyltransferase [Brucella intermedia]MCO7726458.1 GNAT family N-acetyltransferase [Brucella intermedia]